MTALIFAGTFASIMLAGLAFMPSKPVPMRQRNFRRVIIRARGVENATNKIGDN